MAVDSALEDNNQQTMEKQQKKPRSKDPGVRVVGGRIYDSQNGKTCHQCRQKTRDFAAVCKNQKGNKQCPLCYCHKCLLNRYGEKAEEVASLNEWKCPKCRDLCNCSLCMKKRGYQPTGILAHTAKQNGFTSVSELLQVKGPENVCRSPNNPLSPKKEPVATSPRKQGKENSCEGKDDFKLDLGNLTPTCNEKKVKKTSRERLKEVRNGGMIDDINSIDGGKKFQIDWVESQAKVITKDAKKHVEGKNAVIGKNESKSKIKAEHVEGKNAVIGKNKSKSKIKEEHLEGKNAVIGKSQSKSKIMEEHVGRKNAAIGKNELKSKIKEAKQEHDVDEGDSKDSIEKVKINGVAKVLNGVDKQKLGTESHETLKDPSNGNLDTKLKATANSHEIVNAAAVMPKTQMELPVGTPLLRVAGVDLPAEAAGEALQFFEFSVGFAKVLDLKKGQAEAIIGEIVNGRRGRRLESSVLIRFHIQLLSLIQEDTGIESPSLSLTNGKNSWLHALGECVAEYEFMSKEFPPECFDKGNEGYYELTTARKLKLLNFLCDEALNTTRLRNWIEDEKSKSRKKAEEAREKFNAAKDKEKTLKQKLQDEIAKAMVTDTTSLSVSEHAALVAKIKSQAAQAHERLLDTMTLLPKKRKRCDAIRTDSIQLDFDGRIFWRLKGYNAKPDILLQDIGAWSPTPTTENWIVYSAEQRNEIERYISYISQEVRRAEKLMKMSPMENNQIESCVLS